MIARVRAALERRLRSERGAFTAMVVALIVMLFVVAGLVVDGGLVLNARAQTYDDLEQAARVGANQIDEVALRNTGQVVLIEGQAESAAASYMTNLPLGDGRGGYSSVDADAVGTTVTVRAERQVNTALLSMIGVGSIPVRGVATAEAEVGIDGPLP